MKQIRALHVLFMILVLGVVSAPLYATTITWDGGDEDNNGDGIADGDGTSWDDRYNWNPNLVPLSGDDVIIGLDVAVRYKSVLGTTVLNSLVCQGLILIEGGSLSVSTPTQLFNLQMSGGTLAPGATVTVTNILLWREGTISGSVVVPASAELIVSDTNPKTLSGTLTLDGAGTIIPAGVLYTFGGSGSINSAGVLDITGTLNGSSPLTVRGTLNLRGGRVNTSVINETLIVAKFSSAINGNFSNPAGATLHIEGIPGNFGNLTIAQGFTNAGKIILTNTRTSSSIGWGSYLTVTSGTLVNQGEIETLEGETANERGLNAVLDNQGLLDLQQGLLMDYNSGRVFDSSTGTINVPWGKLFRISGGTTVWTNNTQLQGSGTIQLNGTHTLKLDTDFTFTNSQPVHDLSGSVTITGAGTLTNQSSWFNLTGDTVDVPLVNEGSLLAKHTTHINNTFTTSPTSVVTVEGVPGKFGDLIVAQGFTNAGKIVLTNTRTSSSIGWGSLLTVTSGTLVNQGEIETLEGETANERTLNAVLDNQGLLDLQQGLLMYYNSGRVFDSSTGTINVPWSKLFHIAGGTTVWTNNTQLQGAGTIRLDGTHTLRLDTDFTFTNAQPVHDFIGSVTITGAGTLTNQSTWFSLTGDTFDAPLVNEGSLLVKHTTHINNAFTTSSTSIVTVEGVPGKFGNLTVAQGFTNAGKIVLTNTRTSSSIGWGSYLNVTSGTLINQGEIETLPGETANERTLNAALDNQGLLNIQQQASITKTSANHVNNGTIQVAGGDLNVSGANSFGNSGTIQVSGGRTFSLNGGSLTNFASNTLTGGTYHITGIFRFPNAAINTNNATVILNGSGSQIVNQSNINALSGLSANGTSGDLTIQNGRNFTTSGVFTNNGNLTVGASSTFTAGGNYTQTSGVSTLSGGTLAANNTVDIQNGTLGGDGTVNAAVINAAEVAPGASPGSLSVNGDYTQDASGVLSVELAGLNPASEFDQLTISSTATLDGTLDVSLTDGFVPSTGDIFTPVTFSTRNGEFAAVNSPDVGAGQTLTTTYNNDNIILSIGSANLPPELAAIGDQTVGEGELKNVTINTTDPNNTTPSLSAMNLPFFASFFDHGDGTGTLSMNPGGTEVGVYSGITITAADADDPTLTDSETISITVNAAGNLVLSFFNPTPEENDYFGYTLAARENRLAVGALWDDVGATNAGSAYLFDTTTGALLHTFNNPTPEADDLFGSVAFVGEHVLVGAGESDVPGPGAAYLFHGTTGALIRTFNNPTPQDNDRFGATVAAMGSYALVGAYQDDTGSPNAGTVYMFDANPASASFGTLIHTFQKPNRSSNNYFGYDIDVKGNRILITSIYDNTGASGAGAAFLFDGNPSSPTFGTAVQSFFNPQPNPSDEMGRSAAFVGDNVLVGAPLDDTDGNNAGAAYLFDSTTGALLQTFRSPAPGDSNDFGRRVSGAGNVAVISARGENVIYLFDADPTSATFGQRLETLPFDGHGASVAQGNLLFIGSIGDDTGASNAGAVYAFDVGTFVNTSPVLSPVGHQNIAEGESQDVIVRASDADGSAPILSATSLPAFATFTDHRDGTGTLHLAPDFTHSGTYTTVTITAADAGDPSLRDDEAITITVTDVNPAPVLTAIGDLSVVEGEVKDVLISASDPDGTKPVLSASNLPAFATFTDNNNATGTLHLAPDFTQMGTFSNVVFTATDENDPALTDSETISIIVTDVNRPPVLAIIPDPTLAEGEIQDITVSASDPDGTTPKLSASNLPPFATFTDNTNGTGVLHLSPNFAQAGTYADIQIAAEDAQDASIAIIQSITITVTETSTVFTEAGAGVNDTRNGVGAVWADFNADNNLDLYVANFGDPNRLYKNNNDGTFTDVAPDLNLHDNANSQGAIAGDYNNDGNIDLYVTTWQGVNRLYRNNGNGSFSEIATDAGVTDPGGSTGASWIDANVDGDLDLYVSGFGRPNLLYQNNGDETFSDIAPDAGVADTRDSNSPIWGDYNADGQTDLYVVHFNSPNSLYRNNGDGTFTDVAPDLSVDDNGSGRSAAWADADNDGDLDLYIAKWGMNRFYRNNGSTFSEYSRSAGIADGANSNGVAWADTDNDGDIDLYVTNWGSPNPLFENNGDATFTNAGTRSGADDTGVGLGATFADYDNDGDVDLYLVNNTDSENRLYQNNNSNNHYLTVHLVGTTSNRSAIGARVTAIAGSTEQHRDLDGGSGYFSQPSLPIEFGLGTASFIDELRVRWPAGTEQTLFNIAADQTITITEINDPPVLQAIGDQVVNEGVLLSFTVNATDPDNDPLTLSASNLPFGATFDPLTGEFAWRPDFAQAGTYSGIRFEVTDDVHTVFEEITIIVADASFFSETQLPVDVFKQFPSSDTFSIIEAAMTVDHEGKTHVAVLIRNENDGDYELVYSPDASLAPDNLVQVRRSFGFNSLLSDIDLAVDQTGAAHIIYIHEHRPFGTPERNISYSRNSTADPQQFYNSGLLLNRDTQVEIPSGGTRATWEIFGPAIDVDKQGRVHVAFYAQINDGWRTPAVVYLNTRTDFDDPIAALVLSDDDPTDTRVDIQVDFDRNYHIVIGNRYTTNRTNQTHVIPDPIPGSDRLFGDPTLSLTSGGDPQIVYRFDRDGISELYAAKWTGSDFENERISAPGDPNITYPAHVAAIDAANRLHTLYIKNDGSATEGLYQNNMSGVFASPISILSNVNLTGQGNRFAIDHTGFLHAVTTEANVFHYYKTFAPQAPEQLPPVIFSPGDQVVAEGQNLSFTVSTIDPNGVPANLGLSSYLPNGATFDTDTGAFSWIPNFIQQGMYTVKFLAHDQVVTTVQTLTITVQDIPIADLAVVKIALEDLGDRLRFIATVMNRNNGSASDIGVVLSIKHVHGTPTVIGEHTISSLGFLSTEDVSAEWPIELGEWELSVVVDPNNTVEEGDETNNLESITISTWPDLAVESFDVQAPTQPGDPYLLSAQILNDSDRLLQNVRVRFLQLSNSTGNNTQATQDIVIPQLDPRSVQTLSANWSPNRDIWDLSVVVDPHNEIQESIEANNYQSTIVHHLPDFVAGELQITPSSTLEQPFGLSIPISNIGPYSEANVRVRFEATKIGVPGFTLIEEAFISQLPGLGGKETVSTTWRPSPGQWTITVFVDKFNERPELDESNNTASVSLDLLPDLVAGPLAISRTSQSSPVDLSLTIANIGHNDAHNVKVRFLYTTPGSQTGTPIDNQEITFLAANGGQVTLTATWQEPLPGSWLLKAIIDPWSEITELDENNNQAIAPFDQNVEFQVLSDYDGNQDPNIIGRFITGVPAINTITINPAIITGDADNLTVTYSLNGGTPQNIEGPPFTFTIDMGTLQTGLTDLDITVTDQVGKTSTRRLQLETFKLPGLLGWLRDKDLLLTIYHNGSYRLKGSFPSLFDGIPVDVSSLSDLTGQYASVETQFQGIRQNTSVSLPADPFEAVRAVRSQLESNLGPLSWVSNFDNARNKVLNHFPLKEKQIPDYIPLVNRLDNVVAFVQNLDAVYNVTTGQAGIDTYEGFMRGKILGFDGNFEADIEAELDNNLNLSLVGSLIIDPNRTSIFDRKTLFQKKTRMDVLLGPVPVTITIKISAWFSAGMDSRMAFNTDIEFDDGTNFVGDATIGGELSAKAKVLFGVAGAKVGIYPEATFGLNAEYTTANGLNTGAFGEITVPWKAWAKFLAWKWKKSGNAYQGTLFGNTPATKLALLGTGEILEPLEPGDLDANPAVAANAQGNMIMVFVDDRNLDPAVVDPDLFYSIWDGTQFGSPRPIAPVNPYGEMDPAVALDNQGNAMVVWTQNGVVFDGAPTLDDVLNSQEIYFAYYNAQTQIWTTPARITNDLLPDGIPQIAFDAQGNALAVWMHCTDNDVFTRTDWEIYYARWDASAQTWTQPQALTNDTSADWSVTIAQAPNGQAVAVWVRDADADHSANEDTDLYYAVWNGSQFGTPQPLTTDTSVETAPDLIAGPDGTMYLVWSSGIDVPDPTGADRTVVTDRILFSQWTGGSWSEPIVVAESDQFLEEPQITLQTSGGLSAVVHWRGYDDFDGDVFTSALDLNAPGATFSESVQLTDDDVTDWDIATAIDASGNVLLINVKQNLGTLEDDFQIAGNLPGGINILQGGLGGTYESPAWLRIQLLGDDPISLERGTPYVEPGAVAFDSQGNDLAGNLQIADNIDSAVPGAYEVTYTVADGQGNTATATRTVTVVVTPNSYALTAINSMHVKQKGRVNSGFVGVIDFGAKPFLSDSAELVLGEQVHTASHVEISAPNVRVKQKATVEGRLVYTNLVSEGKNAHIENQQQVGAEHWPLFGSGAAFDLPVFRTGTPGTEEVDVKQKDSATLAEGVYGNVRVRQKGTLIFTGGTYHLQDFDIGQHVTVYFEAPTVLLIKDRFALDQKAVLKPADESGITAADILIYVEGINGKNGKLNSTPVAAKVGIQAHCEANIYAPNGTVHLRQKSQSIGSFIGKDVIVGEHATVDLQSGWKTPGVIYVPAAVLSKPLASQNAGDDSEAIGFQLMQNHPNPFNPSTTIVYHLPEPASVNLTIYNVLGQEIRRLVRETQQPGFYSVVWDGTEASGHQVASGLYLYRLKAGEKVAVQKMIFAK